MASRSSTRASARRATGCGSAAGAWLVLASTSTAMSTTAPPATCTGPSRSPKHSIARATVTTGSKVETMAAVAGPTASRPVMKA